MASGRFSEMATSQANTYHAPPKPEPAVEDIINSLKPDPKCSEIRAGGGDIQRVIKNHERIMADPVCRMRKGLLPKGP